MNDNVESLMAKIRAAESYESLMELIFKIPTVMPCHQDEQRLIRAGGERLNKLRDHKAEVREVLV